MVLFMLTDNFICKNITIMNRNGTKSKLTKSWIITKVS